MDQGLGASTEGSMGEQELTKCTEGEWNQYRSLEEMETAVHLPAGCAGYSWLLGCHQWPPCWGSCSSLALASSASSAAPAAAAAASAAAAGAGSGSPAASAPASVH